LDVVWVDSDALREDNVASYLGSVDGILVPGGFGDRGIEGMIQAVRYSRENNVPYFGLCLGLHVAVIEFARNVLGLPEATSREFRENTPDAVIDLLLEQKSVRQKGGTMRLGAYPCKIKPDTKLHDAYAQDLIQERHRHRYEFNNHYLDAFQEKGMVFSGISPDGRLVEVLELPELTWFLACQFHPEFKSRPYKSHPLFRKFVAAAKERKR
jgi:CTP synthase